MTATHSWIRWGLVTLIAGACTNGGDPDVSSSRANEISGTERQVNKTNAAHVSINDTIGYLLKHPAFAGFAPLMLPRDDRRYDETLPVRDISSRL